MRFKTQRNWYCCWSDVIAITHLIVANTAIVVGSLFPSVFYWVETREPGLDVVYRYLDAPVYSYLSHFDVIRSDVLWSYAFGELVVVISSIVYWVIAFLLMKAFFLLFE